MEEQMIREWKRKGYTDRDWTKLVMIYFDEDNIPKPIELTKYKAMQKEQMKQ